MQSIRHLIVFSLMFFAISSGCAQRRPGVTQRFGYYERYFRAEPAAVARAAEQVLTGLDQQVLENTSMADGGTRVTGRNFQDTRIIVTATPDAGGSSKVGVKVTPGENEGLSLRVLDLIQEKLK